MGQIFTQCPGPGEYSKMNTLLNVCESFETCQDRVILQVNNIPEYLMLYIKGPFLKKENRR